jgi:ferredoxin
MRSLKIISSYRSLNLLAHAQLEETDIGSSCGGHGICGGDRVRPLCPKEWLSPPTEQEREHLGETEIAAGWRLGCQTYPAQDDLEIELELRG